MSHHREPPPNPPLLSDSQSLLAPFTQRLAQGETVVITGLGDSLTYGWMVKSGFYERFVLLLKSRFPRSIIRSFNEGIPGDTAAGGSGRAPDIVSLHPDVVIVQFGLNDMAHGIRVEAFGHALASIIRQLRRTGALPVLVTSTPLPRHKGRAVSEIFYERIEYLCREMRVPGARLDLYWREHADPEESWTALVHPDNVHPSDEGHALMAEGLLELFPLPRA